MTSRIEQQLAFLNEADKLKSVTRGTTLNDGSRKENSAEHSWHISLYVLTLAEHANRPINVDRVIKMLLLHDIVEIDAGDNPIHGDHDPVEMEKVEKAAADRIFGLLPKDQRDGFRALWDEFEAAETDDAIFAKSIDRVQPVIANLESGGGSWHEYDVDQEKLERRVAVKVKRGAPAIWDVLKNRIDAWFETNT
ncbi:putative hydrolases of HD superfamily [Cognatiyoonia sediminum]|uniref:Putative hydrolases of HD superfamily n=1 Tax=Cognatiyoonia sediminum TaxID=1508389 RepID=A0A1M5LYJ1_9RHOB|nr:HD domain-containing protein [Cognatiyoonia sediminum]SHG69990.1 putative hydrolases of HD superfamily [Cognatiyoonia sediminum]